jgi:hypothetical protein
VCCYSHIDLRIFKDKLFADTRNSEYFAAIERESEKAYVKKNAGNQQSEITEVSGIVLTK